MTILPVKPPRFNVGLAEISQVNLESAIQTLKELQKLSVASYVCVTNTRTSYLANKGGTYLDIQNGSFLTVPDGMPLVMLAHQKGLADVGRVSGPKLLEKILAISESQGYSHYFYGGSEKTISLIREKLKNEYSGVKVVGLESPPFMKIEEFDVDGLARKLNDAKPDFFWCGLGAPKQEILISQLVDKVDSGILLGVGLAFDYFAGTVQEPPAIVSKFHMDWFFRCLQQPFRARRFIVPFFWMLWLLIKGKIQSVIR